MADLDTFIQRHDPAHNEVVHLIRHRAVLYAKTLPDAVELERLLVKAAEQIEGYFKDLVTQRDFNAEARVESIIKTLHDIYYLAPGEKLFESSGDDSPVASPWQRQAEELTAVHAGLLRDMGLSSPFEPPAKAAPVASKSSRRQRTEGIGHTRQSIAEAVGVHPVTVERALIRIECEGAGRRGTIIPIDIAIRVVEDMAANGGDGIQKKQAATYLANLKAEQAAVSKADNSTT